MATNITQVRNKIFIGTGAPSTNDNLVSDNSTYPLRCVYIDEETRIQYVRTGIAKVAGDWVAATGGSSYLVYTAWLTQSGTDSPVADVLEKTLVGTVVWTRDDVGIYLGTLAGAFTLNKTVIPPFDRSGSVLLPLYVSTPADVFYSFNIVSVNQVRLSFLNAAGNNVEMSSIDGLVIPVNIFVYP